MPLKKKYLDAFTDFGFKKLFGSETHKDLLIDFLNELFRGKKHISDLVYLKSEQLGRKEDNRMACFDLLCENENGEKFIIEMQSTSQHHFKDRSLYYATFPIQEQGLKGGWNYRLKEIYAISVMDFVFDPASASVPDRFLHEVKLVEIKTGEVFYDKLTFIYLEMPKFSKTEGELASRLDKWLYLLKNLNKFDEIPLILQEQVFEKLFHLAMISNLTVEDMKMYDESLKRKRDWQNALATKLEEGRKEGIEEGRKAGIEEGIQKVASQLKKSGMPVDIIADMTGLSIDEINKL